MVSVIFNGQKLGIEEGNDQWFETTAGRRRLIQELQEMKHFPKVFPVSLHQDYSDLYFIIQMRVAGIDHKIRMQYDPDHPEYNIDVTVEYPRLDMSRMVGHWFDQNKPCYVHTWDRSWTALKTATQVRRWLEEYYKSGTPSRNYYLHNYNYQNVDDTVSQADEMIKETNSRLGWRRFF